ncbi:MAG TPA: hypothetical protein VG184_01550 [Acidimicrobiales bacterium]|nr:hypothetical protein [Acidimicrobiales bacterium]
MVGAGRGANVVFGVVAVVGTGRGGSVVRGSVDTGCGVVAAAVMATGAGGGFGAAAG